MKKKSFIRELFAFLLIMMVLLFTILGVFLFSSYEILEKEIKDSTDAFLKIYSNEISNSIMKMDDAIKTITAQTVELAKLKSEDESERVLASITLHNFMTQLVAGNELVDALVVYMEDHDICLDAISGVIRYPQKNQLREYAIRALNDETIENVTWQFVTMDGLVYLYKPVKYNGRIIVLFTQLKQLLSSLETQENSNRFIFLTDPSGEIGKVWGNENEEIQELSNISEIDKKSYYTMSNPIGSEQLYLHCYTVKDGILEQTHTGMIVVAIMVVVAVAFMLFFLYFTKTQIIQPMKIMIHTMECIKNGDYEKRMQGEFHSKEFELAQLTTNQMVEEIIGLKIQAYEECIQLQDMQLRSIRLQLKPHFFLNALTTISSLSGQGKNTQIKEYIDVLSKNIRYMFGAGFHTVSIRDEIKHVENYFEMQELKYPGCVFYLIDLPEELADWKIPQMLIHTFIENEYKYSVQMDSMLTVLIKVSKETYQDEEMLLLEIEDDGKGYPEDVLSYMNGLSKKEDGEGNRIGLWSIRRMMELMYERKNLVILENREPHGCLNRIYIPKQPEHEIEEKMM